MSGSKAIRLAALMAATLSAAGCASVQQVQRIVYTPCHDTKLTLYFEAGSQALTADGDRIVGITAHRLKGCKVTELSLVGLADPTGSPVANLTLSQERADNVLAAFVHAGLPVPKYTLVAAGQKGAITPTGAVEPVRRQVDATVVISR
jgi:outer membrane protein OmpA-like peptidoglycan-associated protein